MINIKLIGISLQYLEPFNSVQIKLSVFNSNAWDHLTMCKQMTSSSFKKNCFLQTIYK